MPTARKKRIRGDEESEEEIQVAPDSARKRSRNVPSSATKTPSTRKSTRLTASDNEEPESSRSTRSSRKTLTSVSRTVKPLTATKPSIQKVKTPRAAASLKRTPRTKPMTPPSPLAPISPVQSESEEDETEHAMISKPVEVGTLDERFALVDDRRHRRSSPSKKHSSDHMQKEQSFYRYLLPSIYIISFVLIMLIVTGMAPGMSLSGVGRPSHEQDLLNNVTGHMRTHFSALSSDLNENNARLTAERVSLNAVSERLSLLESDEARVKQRLEDAIAKVDRLIWGAQNKGSSSSPLHHDKATLSIVELDALQLTARELEKKVRGHLENIAKTIVAEAKDKSQQRGGGALSESQVQKHFFEKWVEQSYFEMRPQDETYIPKAKADKLIKQYVATFAESECSGLHDFAGMVNGARVFSASKTFGQASRSWLNPLSSAPVTKSSDVAIRRGNEQGECWPMAGTKGSLLVDLANNIHVGSITLMHIHPRLAPNGDVSSALKDFKVFAYPADGGEKFEIVTNQVFDNSAGCVTFPVSGDGVSKGLTEKVVRRVGLEVLSNHGREDLTCIYRFMVHGEP